MVKAVFFDIDGTLVSFKTHVVPESTKEAIRLLKSEGIKVFIATGRQFEAINNLGDLIFDGYITLNGSYCFENQQEVIYEHSIPRQDIAALIDYMEDRNSFPCIFVREHDFFANYLNEDSYRIFDLLNFPAPICYGDNYKEIALKEKVYQIIAFYKREDEDEILSFLPGCDSTRWSPLFTDVIPKGSSKQVGIDKILEYFNIPLKDTIAFGDGGNDISMLRHARIGVAMGNADEDVKKAADYITTSVDDDGILNALKHFGVIK